MVDLNVTSLSENRAPPDTGVDSSARALSSTTGPGLASVTGAGSETQLAVDMGIVCGLAREYGEVAKAMREALI